MTARTPIAHAHSRGIILLAGLLTALTLSGSGCTARRLRHEADRVPARGVIDPEQARELEKTTLPRYVVEPPDELDITIKPSPPDWSLATFVVQQDGMVDLGLYGDVYVVGLTLEQIEQKICSASHARRRAAGAEAATALSRLGSVEQLAEQVLLCNGDRHHAGTVSDHGERDGPGRDPSSRS